MKPQSNEKMSWNLSNFIQDEINDEMGLPFPMIDADNVKGFIRKERILLAFYKNGTYTWKEFLKKRKELAGDKLV